MGVALGSNKCSKITKNAKNQCMGTSSQTCSLFEGVRVPQETKIKLMRVLMLLNDQNVEIGCINGLKPPTTLVSQHNQCLDYETYVKTNVSMVLRGM